MGVRLWIGLTSGGRGESIFAALNLLVHYPNKVLHRLGLETDEKSMVHNFDVGHFSLRSPTL